MRLRSLILTLSIALLVLALSNSCRPGENSDRFCQERVKKDSGQGPHEKGAGVRIGTPQNRTVIAFGSCSKQFIANQRWEDILKHQADIWIWLGDNIYADTHDMDIMKEKYDYQKRDPGYQSLLRSSTRIIGTWDDHDYGMNDSGKNYSMKKESKELFMQFLDIPMDDPVRDHEGVYQSYDYDFGPHVLKVILLDTRYFRDTVYRDFSTRAYKSNPEGDILGEDQWSWLEEELRSSQADLILIGSSIQVVPEEQIYEKWANFPAARKRLFSLIQNYPEQKVVFLSGDRHIAEISSMEIEGLDYPVYDFTSSGLTHSWKRENEEPNKYRVSDFIMDLNFGIIIIDWDAGKQHNVLFQIRGENDRLLYEMKPVLFRGN